MSHHDIIEAAAPALPTYLGSKSPETLASATSELLTPSEEAATEGGTAELTQAAPTHGLSLKMIGNILDGMDAHDIRVACESHNALEATTVGPKGKHTAKDARPHQHKTPTGSDAVSCLQPGLLSPFSSFMDSPSLSCELRSVAWT